MDRLRGSLRAGFAAALLIFASAAGASPWQKIAAEGEEDPDGQPYGSLILAPKIADDGAVSFADVPSNPLPNPPSYSVWQWSEVDGVEPLATIVTPPSSAIGWSRPELFADAVGNLAWREGFHADLVECGEGGTSTQPRERLYALPRGGEPALVAATGAAAPGNPGLTIAGLIAERVISISSPLPRFGRQAIVYLFPSPSLDPGGALSFQAHAADDPCFSGSDPALPGAILAPDAVDATTLVVRDGDVLPGPGMAILHRRLDFERIVEPEPAILVLAASDEDGDDVSLLRWTSAGGLENLARTFEPSAFAGGATFAAIEGLTADVSGRIAFFGASAGNEGETLDPDGLAVWSGDGDGVVASWPLAGAVPGAPEGAEFVLAAERDDTVGEPLLVNDAGEVAFVAAFRPAPEAPPTLGLFAPGPDGAPRLGLAIGDLAPGLGGKRITSLAPLHLSGVGTLLAFVIAEAEDLEQDAGWYLLTPSAPPRLLLRASAPIEIAPGDVRSLWFRAVAYDDALTRIAVRVGQSSWEPEAIAVRAVPEPGAGLASAVALAALGRVSARRRLQRG